MKDCENICFFSKKFKKFIDAKKKKRRNMIF